MAFSERTCVVTGAGGFIGRAVCERLAGEGARVHGLDVDPSSGDRVSATGADFSVCDTTDAASIAQALADADLVVHTAALVSDWGAMDDFIRVNVAGTRNVLDAARTSDAQRVVHVSSVAIWGYEHHTPLDEHASRRPCGVPYIDTKGASDALALRRAEAGQPVVVVRPGDVYGPRSTPWAIRPFEALEQRRFTLIGKGDGIMTPVYIDDLVDAIVRALEVPEALGKALTVWDGTPVTCAEFFSHYARMLGRRGIPRLPRPLAATVAAAQEAAAALTGKPPAFTRNAIAFVTRRAPYSNRLAREVLGWEPSVTLEEGMGRTEAWFREVGML